MIWGSILGVLPFTLALPYVGLTATIVLSAIIGLVISSAFSAILVYAQELMPGRVGMVSGLFFGLAFGMGGVGAAVLGEVADWTSIEFVYRICSFLPVIGLLTVFLPNVEGRSAKLWVLLSDRFPTSQRGIVGRSLRRFDQRLADLLPDPDRVPPSRRARAATDDE